MHLITHNGIKKPEMRAEQACIEQPLPTKRLYFNQTKLESQTANKEESRREGHQGVTEAPPIGCGLALNQPCSQEGGEIEPKLGEPSPASLKPKEETGSHQDHGDHLESGNNLSKKVNLIFGFFSLILNLKIQDPEIKKIPEKNSATKKSENKILKYFIFLANLSWVKAQCSLKNSSYPVMVPYYADIDVYGEKLFRNSLKSFEIDISMLDGYSQSDRFYVVTSSDDENHPITFLKKIDKKFYQVSTQQNFRIHGLDCRYVDEITEPSSGNYSYYSNYSSSNYTNMTNSTEGIECIVMENIDGDYILNIYNFDPSPETYNLFFTKSGKELNITLSTTAPLKFSRMYLNSFIYYPDSDVLLTTGNDTQQLVAYSIEREQYEAVSDHYFAIENATITKIDSGIGKKEFYIANLDWREDPPARIIYYRDATLGTAEQRNWTVSSLTSLSSYDGYKFEDRDHRDLSKEFSMVFWNMTEVERSYTGADNMTITYMENETTINFVQIFDPEQDGYNATFEYSNISTVVGDAWSFQLLKFYKKDFYLLSYRGNGTYEFILIDNRYTSGPNVSISTSNITYQVYNEIGYDEDDNHMSVALLGKKGEVVITMKDYDGNIIQKIVDIYEICGSNCQCHTDGTGLEASYGGCECANYSQVYFPDEGEFGMCKDSDFCYEIPMHRTMYINGSLRICVHCERDTTCPVPYDNRGSCTTVEDCEYGGYMSSGGYYLEDLNICVNDCEDYYSDSSNSTCYSKAACDAKEGYFPTDWTTDYYSSYGYYSPGMGIGSTPYKPSLRFCLTYEECTSDYYYGFLFDTENSECIADDYCEGVEVYGLGICTSNCSEHYQTFGSGCYSYTACLNSSRLVAKGETTNYCIYESDCRSESGPGSEFVVLNGTMGANNTCITKKTCMADGVVFEEEGECLDTCMYYLGVNGTYCYTGSGCTNKTGGTYEAVNSTSGAYCLNEDECKAMDGFLYDESSASSTCIAEVNCTAPGIKYPSKGTCVLACDGYLDLSGEICYSEDECNLMTQDMENPYFKAEPADGTSQKYCLSEYECREHASFLFFPSSMGMGECNDVANCTGGMMEIIGEGTCEACDSYYQSDSSAAVTRCFNKQACKDLSNSTLAYYPTTNEDGNQRFCLTEDECKDSEDFLFDSDDRSSFVQPACLLKSQCDKMEVVGEGLCDYCDDLYIMFNTTGGGAPVPTCINEDACNALTTAQTSYHPTTNTKGQKYCLTQDECRSQDGFLYYIFSDNATKTDTCISRDDCLSTIVEATNDCDDSCEYPSLTGDCYTKTECEALTDPQYYTVTDKEGRKSCLTQAECQEDEYGRFVFDLDEDICIEKSVCKDNGKMSNLNNTCSSSCPNYMNGDLNYCYIKRECVVDDLLLYEPDKGRFADRCFTEDECIDFDIDLLVKRDVISYCVPKDECRESKHIVHERACLKICPEGLYKQIGEFKCVTGEGRDRCQYEAVIDGETQTLFGEPNDETRECIIPVTDELRTVDEEAGSQGGSFFEIRKDDQQDDQENYEVDLNYDPRSSNVEGLFTDMKTKYDDPLTLALPQLKVFKEEDRKRVITSIKVIMVDEGRRIIQNGELIVTDYEIAVAESGETFVVMESPGNEQMRVEVEFDRETEFFTTVGGEEVPFKMAMDKIAYNVDAVEEVPQATKIMGYMTMVYDGYLRIISPFVPASLSSLLNLQGFLSQNYQRLFLISQMDFWTKDHNDYLYMNTYKDWLGELNELMFGDKEIESETDNNCLKGWKRFCHFKITRNIFTKGVLAISIFILMALISIAFSCKSGKKEYRDTLSNPESSNQSRPQKIETVKEKEITKNKEQEKEQEFSISKYICYKVFPSFAIGLQTSTVYYLVASIFNRDKNTTFFDISIISSLIILILIVILAGFALTPNTKLHNYSSKVLKTSFSKVFDSKKKNGVKAYLVFGLAYDLVLSSIISLYPNAKVGQAISFICLELAFLGLAVYVSPFKLPLVNVLFIIRRGMFVFQGLVIITITLLKNDSSLIRGYEMVIFVISGLHILLSLALIIIGILDPKPSGSKKKSREDRKIVYQTENIQQSESESVRIDISRSEEKKFENEMVNDFDEGDIVKRGTTSVINNDNGLEVEKGLGEGSQLGIEQEYEREDEPVYERDFKA